MDNNGNLSGYLEKKVPTGMGRMKYRRSNYTLDARQFTLTNFDQATMAIKGADRQAPGFATELKIKDLTTVLYQGGRKFAIKTKAKTEKFRAKSEEEALKWVTAIKKLMAIIKEAQLNYTPVRNTTFKNGPGGKSGKLERLTPRQKVTRVLLPTPSNPLTNTKKKELNYYRNNSRQKGKHRKASRPLSDIEAFAGTLEEQPEDTFEYLPPPPPPSEPHPEELKKSSSQPDANEQVEFSRIVKKPKRQGYRPTYHFMVHNKTLIVPNGAGRISRQTHGRITQLGSSNSFTTSKIDSSSMVKVDQRKVVRPQTHHTGKLLDQMHRTAKSNETFKLLYDTLSTSTSLANKLFQELDDIAVQQMVEQMFLLELKKDDVVCKQNESNNKFFVIESGDLEFLVKPKLKKKDKNELSIFFEGSSYSLMMRNSLISLNGRSSMTAINRDKNNRSSFLSAPTKRLGNNSFETANGQSGNTKVKTVGSSQTEPYKQRKAKKQFNKKQSEIEIGEERSLGIQSTGVYFGELSLLYEESSKVSVIAKNKARVWAIERNQFHIISTEASHRQRKEKLKFLGQTDLFADLLNDKQLASLTEAVEYKYYKSNEIVQALGEDMNRLVWIKEGEVNVYAEYIQDSTQNPLNTLVQGSSFGEIALLDRCLSEYHMISKGECTVLELDIAEVEDIIGSVREFLKEKILTKKTGIGRVSNQQSIINASGFSQLQSAVDQIKLTLRSRMTQRLIGTSNESIGDRTTGRTLRNTFLNPIDVNYTKCPPIVPDIKLTDLCPVSLLGSGCFGTVHLVKNCKEEPVTVQNAVCRKEQTINFFALKLVQRKNLDDSKWQSGLDNELQAWSETCFFSASPFVATLYHTFADRGTVYFLAEYCCGGNLYETLQRFPNRRFEALDVKQFYMANVLNGLEAIHERSIIFRDLKPENILIGQNGYVKITDFGLCKKSFRTFTVCGTPDYIAPEVVLSRGHDCASDFWALGVLLFEMSIGQAPFPGRDAMDKYEAVLAHKKGQFPGMKKARVEIFTDVVQYEQRRQELQSPVALMRDTRTTMNSDYDDDDLPEDVVFVQKFTWDLINRLIEPKKSKRIGVLASGFDGIRNHDFFGDFNWENCAEQKTAAPFVPENYEQEMLEELENEEFEPYDLNLDNIEEDDTGYAPHVNSLVNGDAVFASLFELEI